MATENDGARARESDGPVDRAATDATDAAASDSQASGDVSAPGDATPPPQDARGDEGAISPADAGDGAMDATGPDSGTQVEDASTDARVYFVYSTFSPQMGSALTAVDEHTGAVLWGPVDLASSILPTAAYDGEQVFTVDDTGVVRAFDAATGAPSWTHGLGGFTPSAGPPTAYRGLVYVIEDGALNALDEATGQVR